MSEQQPVFAIEKIYVKDLSLEIPNAPHIFLDREVPEINLQLSTQDACIEGDIYEVMLTITVTARVKEKTMFLVEAHQAGIFRIRNVPGNEINPVLGIVCPNILFPYLRETVSDIVTRAGFLPVILNPVNFEAIYHQKKQQAESEIGVGQKTSETESVH
ncbi:MULTISPECIES: protein-export chaperone SecB [unclassified Nitrosomonas]|jgi:preprotein translocase subunit SecB|uniref:protein-export chaperone SecB n=1 Tax=unclassified Nitrosomonas TaxID=2609265 RepID=UPI00088726EE|nr:MULTISPECIES: protein-export chaperone SecB [unclassified Nitrosomonas]SDH59056.1 preprotein translocase subunit SecB [Nitrosomonas sp. Nm132]SDY19612.1 preprotein translocase subunit SecB [Nitrosomonas sp. Nm58]